MTVYNIIESRAEMGCGVQKMLRYSTNATILLLWVELIKVPSIRTFDLQTIDETKGQSSIL